MVEERRPWQTKAKLGRPASVAKGAQDPRQRPGVAKGARDQRPWQRELGTSAL